MLLKKNKNKNNTLNIYFLGIKIILNLDKII